VILPAAGATGETGMFATIVGGTGIGQLRQVAAVSSNTVTVADPWRLPPDSTSKVVLTYVYKDVLIYKNEIAAFPAGVWGESSASNFVQLDGNSWFNVVDSNICRRTFVGGSVGASALNQSMWNVFQDNQVLELRKAGMFVIFWENRQDGKITQTIGPSTLGNVFRGNTIQITGPQPPVQTPDWSVFQLGSLGGNWMGQNSTYTFPFHLGNIFENNTASGGRRGILAGDWADTLFRNNSLTVDRGTTETPTPVFTPQPILVTKFSDAHLSANTYKIR
jgi:hypothetical protein